MKKILNKENNPAFEIRRSKTGFGAFSLRRFKRKQRIAEYTGKKISNAKADRSNSLYLFDLENGFTLDGSPRSNKARYLNHSCKPNCYANLRTGKVFIYAMRNIAPGDELTFNYGELYYNDVLRHKPKGCLCGHCDGGNVSYRNRYKKKHARKRK
jgi:SET domain-containing protein